MINFMVKSLMLVMPVLGFYEMYIAAKLGILFHTWNSAFFGNYYFVDGVIQTVNERKKATEQHTLNLWRI